MNLRSVMGSHARANLPKAISEFHRCFPFLLSSCSSVSSTCGKKEGSIGGPSYIEVAERLGTTEGTIKVTVHRLRQRYRQLLRAVVSQTVDNPLEIDSELAHLKTILRS
jgi:hypothetical protein